jgi:hypothetical protein
VNFLYKIQLLISPRKFAISLKIKILFLFQPEQQGPLLLDNNRQEGLSASSEEQQGRHRDNILVIVSLRAMDLSIIYDRLAVLEPYLHWGYG